MIVAPHNAVFIKIIPCVSKSVIQKIPYVIVCYIDCLNAGYSKHLKIFRLHLEDILIVLMLCLCCNGILEIYECKVITFEKLCAVSEAVFHIAVYDRIKLAVARPVILCQSAVPGK